MPAASRAEVAYFRAAEVQMAHFGLGKVLLGASCGELKRERLYSAYLANGKTEYILDDGGDPRKFGKPTAVNSTLDDCQLEFCSFALCANSDA